MAGLNSRRLTRQQIARVVGDDHELIKAFEALFAVTGGSADDIVQLTLLVGDVQASAETASAANANAQFQLERIASALEMLAIAPRIEPPPAAETLICEHCAAVREECAALARRVADLESAP